LRGQKSQEAGQMRQAVQIMAQQVQVLALGAAARMRHSSDAIDGAEKTIVGNVVPIRSVS
jgi:hypothetical protein